MIYLASPFSNSDPAVEKTRYEAACHKAAEITRHGLAVFSPIAHSVAIARHGLPTDFGFWEPHDRAFIENCSELWVLMLPGWKESKGVQAEIRIAEELGKKVVYVEPEEEE